MPVTTKCWHCGASFTRDADQIRRAKFSFCSVECKRANPDFRTYAARRNGDKQRDRGAGKSYRKRNGRHEHRLVVEQALGRPLRSDEVVHHRDGNKRNNALSNLEVMSQSEHMRIHLPEMRRAVKNPARGSRSGNAKLDESAVLAIRLGGGFGASTKALAAAWGVSTSTIQRILSKELWTHV